MRKYQMQQSGTLYNLQYYLIHLYSFSVFFRIVKLSILFKASSLSLHGFTTFTDDILAAGLTVLRHLLWYLILYLFRLFSRKWHKIPVAGSVR